MFKLQKQQTDFHETWHVRMPLRPEIMVRNRTWNISSFF
jgi:hypothetical protein